MAHGKIGAFPVEGADQFIDRGLVYQNKLIYWFNHYLEKTYDGPRYDLTPGAIVVGGGLASIDVVKVLQIEMTLAALKARGIASDMLALEREGIEPVLAASGLKYGDLGVAPCKLYYRRRVLDMPLSDIPPGRAGQTCRRTEAGAREDPRQGAAQISVRVPGTARAERSYRG